MGHGGGKEYDVDPMYWLMPLGLGLGVLVVLAFEHIVKGLFVADRTEAFKALTNKGPGDALHPTVEALLKRQVDGYHNIVQFWSGGALHLNVSKDHYAKVYEMLAVVCALLFSVSVSFYTASPVDHSYGLVCCISNCALWMGSLSSAFFLVIINSCDSEDQAQLMVELYGPYLMRVPMMMFVWGTALLFLEFILYFKLNVDSGFNCSVCLGACFVIAPLFFHCLHKMGWVAMVVHAEEAAKRSTAKMPSPERIKAVLHMYVASKGPNFLALDRDEFLDFMKEHQEAKMTSVQQAFAERLFEAHVEHELKQGPMNAVPPLST